jgi:hypothetical protein
MVRGSLCLVLMSIMLAAGLTSAQDPNAPESESMLSASPEGVFWNTHSQRFIYPPAFNFPEREGAKRYRFTLRSLTDGAPTVFYAATPTASLAPVWDSLPTDSLLLLVEAVTGESDGIPVAERRFIKSPQFARAYSRGQRVEGEGAKGEENVFRAAGFASLDSLYRSPRVQHWLQKGEPNPEYPLWVYPAKVMSATVRAMVAFSSMVDDDERSERAINAAILIADFMLNLREPVGSPLAGWPPVHWRGVEPENHPVYEGEFMVQFPAEAGLALLDLYDLTSDSKYFDAAKGIADRYAATQREDGTWYLLLMAETGEPGRRKNLVLPTYMIEVFDRLDEQYGIADYRDVRRRAVDWIMANPVATFAWEAQFEDTRPKPSLQNLAYRPAAYTARLLFNDPETVETAELILRFVEDQFIVWDPSDPMLFKNWFSAKNSQWNGNDPKTGKDWFLPAVLEQYAFYTPIAGAAGVTMDVYMAAYQATGNEEYRAKAVALANSVISAQEYHGGGEIPTHMRRSLPEKNWTNVGVHAALKLIEHAEVLGSATR